MKIEVPVSFEGTVTVDVPDAMKRRDALLLVEKLVLARMLATTDNPDAPEDVAFEEYKEECSKTSVGQADKDWDACKIEGVGGTWNVWE